MNVLLSTYDFSNDNCYPKLKEHLKPNMRVVIIPFSHGYKYYKDEELFDTLYNYDYGKDYNILCKEFYQFGIEKHNVYVLNPFRDTIEYMKYRIDKADVVFFTGGNPVSFMRRIKQLNLLENLINFKGITIGASAGTMVQMKEFMTYYLPWEHYPYRYHRGLGYVEGIDVVVHWENNEWQDIAKIISHIERRIPFLNLPDGKCIIFNN